MTQSIHTLVSMLQYMRPAYTMTERKFCELYLEPEFGPPDVHGNYIKIIGKFPKVAFTAHTDTVHRIEGIQKLAIENSVVTSVTGSCLGADCTTGLWLMLGMIERGVEGVYIAHAAEEIGGLGSSSLVRDNPTWMDDLDFCISFDRFGTNSVITHQGGQRTASDAFVDSFIRATDLQAYRSDGYGTYTDSMEYSDLVSECTNISVGYDHQHTSKENQDLTFAAMLLEKLCEADWTLLEAHRDPRVVELDDYAQYAAVEASEGDAIEALQRLITDRPVTIAGLLFEYGFTVEGLCEELNLDMQDYSYYTDNYYGNKFFDQQEIPY